MEVDEGSSDGQAALHAEPESESDINHLEVAVDSDAHLIPDETIKQHKDDGVEFTKNNDGQKSSFPNISPLTTSLLVGCLGAIFLGLKWLRRGSRHGKSSTLSKEKVYLHWNPLPDSAPPTTGKLSGKTLVVSDRFDIQGLQTRFGSDVWQSTQDGSTSTAAIVELLTSLSAVCEATVPIEPLGLGPLLSSSPCLANPCCKGRVHGGGEYGATVAVAARMADLGLVLDELGSALVPAACCGVYALRPTQGMLPSTGSFTTSPSLASVGLVATSAGELLLAGQALKLPKSSNEGDVASYLVAEDLFAACGQGVLAAMPAVVAAVKRWAGSDHAQGLSLCEWLYHRYTALRAFFPEERGSVGSAPMSAGQRTDMVLHALGEAADAIKMYELWQMMGPWADINASSLPKEALDEINRGAGIPEQRYQQAVALAEELRHGFRGALQSGYIFVIPTIPDQPPKCGNAVAVAEYRQLCKQLAALSSLAGAPQVAMPISIQGKHPISVSLLALHRSDLSLVKTACKLAPLLAEEVAALSKRGSKDSPGNKMGHKSPPARKSPSHDNKAAAEAAKEDGNTALKANKLQEAMRRYSEAIALDPHNAVYFSNRALAYLKLGNYTAAEADCDSALDIDPSAVKALLRRGSARLARGDTEAAREDFMRVTALEPNNKQARAELKMLKGLEQVDF